MEKNKIVLGFLIISIFLAPIGYASSECDNESIQRYIHATNYKDAAICYDANHDWDNAIKYQLKDIEQKENSSKKPYDKYLSELLGLTHMGVAEDYSKKGPGYEKEEQEQCDLAEENILTEVNDDPEFGGKDYYLLADCFLRANDTEKACIYCNKDNEYSRKKGMQESDCVLYGCPKSSNSTPSNAGSSSGNSSGFPIVLVVGGLIVIVLIATAFFLLNGKKRKAK